MSQITRCPSCATAFKVVADQLRISQGWVRCGQCKEIFDASAHLLASTPSALLPDFPLTDVRQPPALEVSKAHAEKAWGDRPSSGAVSPPNGVPTSSALNAGAMEPAPLLDPSAGDENAVAVSAEALTPVLEAPEAGVPALLAAEAAGPGLDEALGLEQEALFSWRALAEEPAVDTLAIPVSFGQAVAELAEPVVSGRNAPEDALALEISTPLPTWENADNQAVVNASPAMAVPALFTNHPDSAVTAQAQAQVQAAAAERTGALTLVEDDSPGAVLQAAARKLTRDSVRPHDNEGQDGDAGEAEPAVQPEVSFVVTAKRKAFWRKPVVRSILVLLALVCVVGLALQIAVQERSRIAAMDLRAKPWLLTLCEPWACEIAPYRQIADVVIDSSSFAKARGDSYQLSFTMKNNSPVALALPAVEITLTDAQDQPVLRRVLLPADMAAPAELAANGSWSTSLSVIVTTGGARVSGYRLLAFYP